MSRWLKALPLTLALAALSFFATSCGSSNTQIRFVHAIQDAGALDIDVGGPNASNTPEFTNISFLGVQPNQPGYTTVPSSTNTLKAFLTGTTTEVFGDSVGWNGGSQHTLIATGFSKTGNSGSNVVLLSVPDNIPTPPSGDVAFRVIHASPSGPGTVDVYIELNPNNGPGLPVTIQGLSYTQASNYVFFSFNPNNNPTPPGPPGYTVYVTASGSMTPIISEGIYPANAGAVRTLVLTDVQDGTSMQTDFLELSDAD